ncbi:helix-turn-helix domain-containing protein [Actinosynnema sp. ALI-1.44]|uniref:helix-turn-helix domain-containing protein n=1 Tax=Actinosynnema sp. ALI-1.44 TaxID=1933779 RepID=UPI00097C374F|nr:helix-turn-helix domain-containing protein [Actinosynnema sp. ALI-1.44]
MRRTTVLPGTPDPVTRRGEPPMHPLVVPGPAAAPFVIGGFDFFGPDARASFAHRHTYHEIIHITGGTGAHVVDMTAYGLDPPNLAVVRSGQLHHWDDVTGLEGTLVLFTEDFLIDHRDDRDLLRDMGNRPWLTPRGEDHAMLAGIIDELEYEFRSGCETTLRALLHVLIVRLARTAGTTRSSAPARSKDVANEFAALTNRADLALWTVRDYARRIGVTPQHLAAAVRAATGRSPAEVIREARVIEAKRLLARTSLSVRQVARRTGFADPAYFCRFFRRETSLSPGAFRRRGDHMPSPTPSSPICKVAHGPLV